MSVCILGSGVRMDNPYLTHLSESKKLIQITDIRTQKPHIIQVLLISSSDPYPHPIRFLIDPEKIKMRIVRSQSRTVLSPTTGELEH